MINIKNKKVPLSVLLISIILIIFTLILKEKRTFSGYNDFGTFTGYKVKNVIRFLDIQLSYNNTLFYLFISVILSILALIFLDENTIVEKLSQLYRRIYIDKENKQKIINFLKGYSKKTFIVILAIIIFLLFVNKCNKTNNVTIKETAQDTIFEVVEAPIKDIKKDIIKVDSTQNNKIFPNQKTVPENKQNTIDPFSKEGIHQLANSTATGRAIQEGRKYSPNAGTGVITLGEGIDTDQLEQVAGESGTLNASSLGTAKINQSNRNKH